MPWQSLDEVAALIAEVHRAGGFVVPITAHHRGHVAQPQVTLQAAPTLGFLISPVAGFATPSEQVSDASRGDLVLALSQAGYEVRAARRLAGCEVRMRAGRLQYRRPGRRGAWAMRDPDAAELDERRRRFMADLARLQKPFAMAAVRAGKAGAKAQRDAAIVETFEALGLLPRQVPEHSRAAMVASLHRCTACHVRNVIAAWRKKSETG